MNKNILQGGQPSDIQRVQYVQGGQPFKKPRLKKAAFITSFILHAASLFALDIDFMDEKMLFEEIAENFDVTKIQMPDERAEYYEEQYVQFIKQYNGKTTKPRTQFTERGRTYTIEFFDFGTNVFYATKGKFKIIDDDNQIIQVLSYDDIDDPYYGFFDADMDGSLDLMIMDQQYKGDTTYHIYYWSNMKKMFEEEKHIMKNPAWDKKNKFMYEKYWDKTGELVYMFYEFRFGVRRFVAQVRFSLTNYEKGWELKVVYSDTDGATEGDKDVYVFQLPLYNDFKEMSQDEQKNVRKQYEKIAKMLNAL